MPENSVLIGSRHDSLAKLLNQIIVKNVRGMKDNYVQLLGQLAKELLQIKIRTTKRNFNCSKL